MDSSADPANDLTPRRASEWLIALGERPDDRALRARLDAWLAARPENRRDWEEMSARGAPSALWNRSNPTSRFRRQPVRLASRDGGLSLRPRRPLP